MAKKRLITEIGKYVLLQNLEYTDYAGTEPVEIGKIVDSFSKEDVMYIYYNKNNYKETGYHINIDVYVGDKGEFPVANTDDLHRACIYDQPDVFLAMMLHEYGHYKNGDLNRQDLTNKSIQDDRLHCIRIGRVQDTERKADAFAVRYVGKAAFLKSIDYMILKRMQRNEDPSVTALAIREFELRKRAVKNM